MLTDEEFAAEHERRSKITTLRHELKKARDNLDFANKHGTAKTWVADLGFKKSEWINEKTSLTVTIPFGVVQQQMVNAVAALEREIVKLGGTTHDPR